MLKIDEVLKELRKQHGESVVKKASELPPLRSYPVGVPTLDIDLGSGLLWGRTTIIAGKPQSGKTTLANMISGRIQKEGGLIIWFDVEKQYDKDRAILLGVNPDDVVLYDGEDLTAEGAYNYLRDSIRVVKEQNIKSFFIIDSLASLTIEALFDKEASNQFGGSSRVINQLVTVGNQLIADNQQLILINQLRDKLGSMGEPDQMPQGKAQEYIGSSIIWMRDGETIKDGNVAIGKNIKWTIKKSRSSSPKNVGECRFYFQTGFDVQENLIDAALELELIERSGSWMTLPNGERVQGKDKLVSKLKENKEYMKSLWDIVYTKMGEKSGVGIWNGEE